MTPPLPWTKRIWPNTNIPVGPCAWRAKMLVGEHVDYIQTHPSLIVVDPSDDVALLERAGKRLKNLPILLGFSEPAFARQLEGHVMQRIASLGLERVDALVLHVDDPAEVKSGGMLQTLFALRDRGLAGTLGLAHSDARAVEWLAMNSAVRLMGVNYALAEQAVRHRALEQIQAYGMSAYALTSPAANDIEALRFGLSEASSVLPVLDQPIPAGLTPMSRDAFDQAWQRFQQSAPPPKPLERGKPPMVGDEDV